ncbi:transposase [Streptomyces sp. SAS_276]
MNCGGSSSRCRPCRRRSWSRAGLESRTARPCAGSCSLHTGIQWEYLPQEPGSGSGMTCRRRPAAWNEAGVWDQLQVLPLNTLRSKNQPDWSRAVIDSSHVRAARRGPKADPARPTPRPPRPPPTPTTGPAASSPPRRRTARPSRTATTTSGARRRTTTARAASPLLRTTPSTAW